MDTDYSPFAINSGCTGQAAQPRYVPLPSTVLHIMEESLPLGKGENEIFRARQWIMKCTFLILRGLTSADLAVSYKGAVYAFAREREFSNRSMHSSTPWILSAAHFFSLNISNMECRSGDVCKEEAS